MSIHFDQIHNIVRTYQRVLDLEPSEGPRTSRSSQDQGGTEGNDKVSISSEARQLQQASSTKHGGPESDVFKR